MRSLSYSSARIWRAVVGLGLVACLGASAGASVGPRPPQQNDDPLKFTRSGRMLLVYQVTAADAQNFSLTWRTIKDLLAKKGDPALAAFAKSLDIQRVETEPGADAVFVFHLNPVSTTYSYHPVTLLFKTLAEDPAAPGVGLTYDQATELYDKIKGATAATWWLSAVN
jgi:hypothetical protein